MDPISDMLVRIKNAQLVNAERVSIPSSRVKFAIAGILKDAGFVAGIEKKKKKIRTTEYDYLDILLRYDDRRPAISGMKRISKPSRHLYIKAQDIKAVRSGFGVAVLSTSKGIMSSKDARRQGLGGEVLFEIW